MLSDSSDKLSSVYFLRLKKNPQSSNAEAKYVINILNTHYRNKCTHDITYVQIQNYDDQ